MADANLNDDNYKSIIYVHVYGFIYEYYTILYPILYYFTLFYFILLYYMYTLSAVSFRVFI